MTEYLDIEALMAEASQWACLVGPQAAGKTVFTDYLRQYEPGQAHHWSLVPLMRSVTGDLSVRSVDEIGRSTLLDQAPVYVTRPIDRRFDRSAGTKDIVLLQASVGRELGRQISIPFFDVPGEWAGKRAGGETDAMHQLLARTQLFVLFISFWGVLPPAWLVQNASRTLGAEIWGTSMAGGADGEEQPYIENAVQALHADAQSWLKSILSFSTQDIDVLVVLSQFQRSTAVPLFNAYIPGLGDEIWRRYDAQHVRVPPRGLSVHNLAAALDQTEAIGQDLLTRVDEQSKRDGSWTDHAITSRLIRLGDRSARQMQWEAKARRRVRSWSILPMNVLEITHASRERWYRKSAGDGLEDFRMCEDVLWWLMLHQKAKDLWRA